MLTFIICLALLVAAYFTYGAYLDKVCGINPKNSVPSTTHYDGVDYLPLPRWRTFLIQLLNIAGIGPIFGAIMGACFGPVVFLWITLGGIFIGAMHDYVSGVIFLRNDGLSMPEIVGRYLGNGTRQLIRYITILLLLLVGVVFLRSPASILGELTPSISYWWWIGIIFAYYFIATMLPVDKLIGKVYPIFGAALMFMALGLLGVLLFGDYTIPNLTFETFRNYQPNAADLPIIPTLFISVACGAVSGFHATQTPLMARCLNNENESRMVFFGAMISESIIALIWAAIAIAFFSGADSLAAALAVHGNNAAWVVFTIANTTLGVVGGILALLGVVAAPITTGDTAFRSARLIVADILKIEQRSIPKRLLISLPLFLIGLALVFVDFDILWRYFAWSNQAMSVVVLWTIVVYLHENRRNIWVALPPAVFMTYICSTAVFISKQFVGLQNHTMGYVLGGVLTIVIMVVMWFYIKHRDKKLA